MKQDLLTLLRWFEITVGVFAAISFCLILTNFVLIGVLDQRHGLFTGLLFLSTAITVYLGPIVLLELVIRKPRLSFQKCIGFVGGVRQKIASLAKSTILFLAFCVRGARDTTKTVTPLAVQAGRNAKHATTPKMRRLAARTKSSTKIALQGCARTFVQKGPAIFVNTLLVLSALIALAAMAVCIFADTWDYFLLTIAALLILLVWPFVAIALVAIQTRYDMFRPITYSSKFLYGFSKLTVLTGVGLTAMFIITTFYALSPHERGWMIFVGPLYGGPVLIAFLVAAIFIYILAALAKRSETAPLVRHTAPLET